jgi:hypothetical protein
MKFGGRSLLMGASHGAGGDETLYFAFIISNGVADLDI